MPIPEPTLSAQIHHIRQQSASLAQQFSHLTETLASVLENTEALRHEAWATQRDLAEVSMTAPGSIPNTDELARALRRFQEIGRQLETVAAPLRLNMPGLSRIVRDVEAQLRSLAGDLAPDTVDQG